MHKSTRLPASVSKCVHFIRTVRYDASFSFPFTDLTKVKLRMLLVKVKDAYKPKRSLILAWGSCDTGSLQ